MKNFLIAILLISALASAQKDKVVKSDAQWKKELSPEVYQSLRKAATEQAFTGKYFDNFEKGTYVCAACGKPLFDSDHKYHSGTGWPAFDTAIPGSVDLKPDNSLNIKRTEVICSRCGGHLGHIFDDGPKETTGKRYCINSVAMNFKPEKK